MVSKCNCRQLFGRCPVCPSTKLILVLSICYECTISADPHRVHMKTFNPPCRLMYQRWSTFSTRPPTSLSWWSRSYSRSWHWSLVPTTPPSLRPHSSLPSPSPSFTLQLSSSFLGIYSILRIFMHKV